MNLFSSSYMRQGWAWSSLSPAVSGLVPPPAWAPGLAEVAQLVMVGLVGVSPGHCWAPREGLLSGWSFQEPRAGGLPRGLSSPLDHVQLHAEFLPSAPQCGMAGPFPGWGQLLQPSLQPSLHGRRCPSLPLCVMPLLAWPAYPAPAPPVASPPLLLQTCQAGALGPGLPVYLASEPLPGHRGCEVGVEADTL